MARYRPLTNIWMPLPNHTYFRESALRHQKRVVVLASFEELNIEGLFLQLKPSMPGDDVIFKLSVTARMIRVARPLVPTNIPRLIRKLIERSA
jgi:hypothetical protein